MRTRAKTLLIFVAGCFVGAVLFGSFVGWHWNRNFDDWYVLGVAGQARIAGEINAGRGPALADQIRDSFPEYVLAITREFSENDWTETALWMIQDVYGQDSFPIPPEIATILEELPPKPPSCCRLPSPAERERSRHLTSR